MNLAEAAFHHDTLACLERLEIESLGYGARSRREYSLIFTERFLDLLKFGRDEKIEFYRVGQAWPFADGVWGEDDRPVLEAKYRALRPGLEALIGPGAFRDPAMTWGGAESAAVAERCLQALAPVAEEWLLARDAGRLEGDWMHLVWSLAHLHAIRLGIDTVPEAVLRYLMYRFHQDATVDAR